MPTNHTRYVSAGKESTFNTPVPATAVGEVESESFQQSYDVLKRADFLSNACPSGSNQYRAADRHVTQEREHPRDARRRIVSASTLVR